MAINSLFPAFFRLFYETAYATHVMTIPCREWDSAGGPGGSFKAWDLTDRDAETQIEALVDVLLPFHVATTTFNQATIYTMDDEDAPPRPRAFVSMTGKVGTSVAAATPASQGMYTFRSTTFGLLKILFFDAPVHTNFTPFTDIASSPATAALLNVLDAEDYGFAARDNGRPYQFVRATFKLNDQLRQEYGYS